MNDVSFTYSARSAHRSTPQSSADASVSTPQSGMSHMIARMMMFLSLSSADRSLLSAAVQMPTCVM